MAYTCLYTCPGEMTQPLTMNEPQRARFQPATLKWI